MDNNIYLSLKEIAILFGTKRDNVIYAIKKSKRFSKELVKKTKNGKSIYHFPYALLEDLKQNSFAISNEKKEHYESIYWETVELFDDVFPSFSKVNPLGGTKILDAELVKDAYFFLAQKRNTTPKALERGVKQIVRDIIYRHHYPLSSKINEFDSCQKSVTNKNQLLIERKNHA